MFRYCILLTVLLCATDYAFACFGVSPDQYSDWEKNWCKADLNRCAWYLCRQKGYSNCNDNFIRIEVIPQLQCNLLNQCQPRTDRLGYACYKNKDCENSNYRCFRGRCAHKATIPTTPSRCYFDSECPNNAYRCQSYQCVKKTYVHVEVSGSIGSCNASPDCPKGYTCKDFRCVPGKGLRSNTPTTCESSPDCAKGYRCVGFKCVHGSGSGSGRGRGGGKYCEEFDSECVSSNLRCDRARQVCVPA